MHIDTAEGRENVNKKQNAIIQFMNFSILLFCFDRNIRSLIQMQKIGTADREAPITDDLGNL